MKEETTKASKTIFIWDTCGEEPIKFFVLKGDYSHFNNVYINNANQNEKLLDELNDLVFDKEGKTKVKMLSKFPMKSARRKGTIVIVCGFLP